MPSAAEPSCQFRFDKIKLGESRFIKLKKIGKSSGYNFIGWLNKTGDLVKDTCPQSPHTPIYWKITETNEWMCFSQSTLHKALVKDAILSVDEWKQLVQNFAKSWRFLGFIHESSGKCIIHVPPPISAQLPKNSTKVRLHTEYGHYDVVADSLKNTLTEESGALPFGCKMRLIPMPSMSLLQAMQCRQNKRKSCTTSSTTLSPEQAPVIFIWQVRSDAPSIVKDCLNTWKEGVALDIHTKRLFDRHARCADKNPNIWFCPPSPEEALKTSWESLLERYHQNLSRTDCW